MNAPALMLAWSILFALGESPIAMVVVALWFVVVLWSAVVFFVVSIRRWHDLNKRGEWCFVIFVPVVGLVWFLVSMAFIRGTQGDNKYGSE